MAQSTLLEWVTGFGWLVFSGGDSDEIRALSLARADADGAVAYISFADDGGDALLDDMEDLGAPTGYMIDLEHESDEVILAQLQDVSVIVIQLGTSLDRFYHAMKPSIIQGLLSAYQTGSLILLEGLAVNIFGKWTISDNGDVWDGLDWVKNAFIEPNVTSAEDSRAVQDILSVEDGAIAIEIGEGSALVLGAGGAIEIWGQKQVTISLGRQYGHRSGAN